MRQSTASALWSGAAQDGAGTVSLASGGMDAEPYGFVSRFGTGAGTDPEELAAAAHATCFSTALSLVLQAGGVVADHIGVKVTVTLGHRDGGPAVTRSHLDVTVHVPGAEAARIWEACEAAKDNCPMSRLFRTQITMDVRVLGEAAGLTPPKGAGQAGSQRSELVA